MDLASPTSKTRRANYRTHEDVAICHAWIVVSCDTVDGLYHSSDDFYGKVKVAWEAQLTEEGKRIVERTPEPLSSPFFTISRAVSKFVGCHGKIKQVCLSGRAPTDVDHDAVALSESTPKSEAFKFIQCWNVLNPFVVRYIP